MQTPNYCLLDIDITSIYHPNRDPLAIARIVGALEPLGLVSYIPCTSSYSGGLHLYFPFQRAQSSWQLAIALACLLENAGFKVQPGQLEIFPNPKPYGSGEDLSLFNAHRLPLQIGSYLLNEAWQPIRSDTLTFVSSWKFAQARNDIDRTTLKQILKQARRKHFGISGKAEKFINDLNAEIELGWTGYGQTNRLLGRITMRAYIFHHILSGGQPLSGAELVNEIVETAQSLPGYSEWCRHQYEIEQRAEEWARCIENSHYFHFGDQRKKQTLNIEDPELITAIDQAPSWNQRQSAATRDRIRRAIVDLLENNNLPVRATARFQTLLKYGIGGGSLYRHRDLWHPNYMGIDPSVENPPHPPTSNSASQLDCVGDASNWHKPPSLLPLTDGDNPSQATLSDRTYPESQPLDNNFSSPAEELDIPSTPPQGVQYIHQALSHIKASQEAFQEASRLAQVHQKQLKSQAREQEYRARMQQFLDSEDPILVAEALAWAEVNPDILQINPRLATVSTHPGDRASILTAIENQMQRINWSDEHLRSILQQLFGKPSLTLLTDPELQQWWQWLNTADSTQL